MKRMNKWFAFGLALVLLFTMTVPVAAVSPTSSAAAKAEALGVLIGAGQGVTAEYLALATNRAQGAVVLLRLMGKEDEAKAFPGTDNFTDVDREWFAPYTAYLKANPELGFVGYPDGSFRPHQIMTVAEFNKVLMTCLGYMQDVDYAWAEVMNKAQSLGLTAYTDGSRSLINNDIAVLMIQSLAIRQKGKDTTLVEFLISEGVVNPSVADQIGLIDRLMIVSAQPTDNNEITVRFNKPAPLGTQVSLRSGQVTIFTTQTWSDNRTELVLTRGIPFAQGQYTLNVGDLDPKTLTIQPAVASQVLVEGNTILQDENAAFTVKTLNQYGRDMNVTNRGAYSITAHNKTRGGAIMVSQNAFTINTKNVAENDIITLTVMHNASSVVGQFDLRVIKTPVVTNFAFVEVVIPENQERVQTNNTNVQVKYDARDQYGNPMTLKDKQGLTFVTSNDAIVNTNNIKVTQDGKLTIDTGAQAGSVTLSVIVNASGNVATMPINVYDPIGVASVRVFFPSRLVISGEATEVTYTAHDQFGDQVSKKDNRAEIAANLSFVSTNSSIVNNDDFHVDAEGVLSVTPTGGNAGNVLVHYYWKGEMIDSFSFEVNEAAQPTAVTGFSYIRGIELGAVQTIPVTDISVVDQYDRDYNVEARGMTAAEFLITRDGNAIEHQVVGENIVFTAGNAEGQISFTIGIRFGASDQFLPNSTRSFNMRAYDVTKTGITFQFASFPTLYSNPDFTQQNVGDYAKAVEVIGRAADGTHIALKQDKISNLVSSNSDIVVFKDGDDFKLFAKSSSQTATSEIRAYDDTAKLLCEMTVSSSRSRSIHGVTFGEDTPIASGQLNGQNIKNVAKIGFRVYDQYGVNMLQTAHPAPLSLSANGFFTSSNNNILSVSADGVMTVGNTGTVTITYTTATGLQDSIRITIE